jgi:hypothetical protein
MKKTQWMILVASVVIGGCALPSSLTQQLPQTYPLDGVKWIRSDVETPDDLGTVLQPRYQIAGNMRVLMRFEDFISRIQPERVNAAHPIEVSLTLTDPGSRDRAIRELRLCPLRKNWMMLATWKYAYPMGASGRWTKEGGDFVSEECLTASAGTGATLSFDVTSWYLNDVRSLGFNYGFVLMTLENDPIVVEGDQTPSFGPKITWYQN